MFSIQYNCYFIILVLYSQWWITVVNTFYGCCPKDDAAGDGLRFSVTLTLFWSFFQAKLSFSLNIISFFWSLAAIFFCSFDLTFGRLVNLKIIQSLFDICLVNVSSPFLISFQQLDNGIRAVVMVLLIVELLIALFLIYWLSKAVCRDHFNTLVCCLLFTHISYRSFRERRSYVTNSGLFFLAAPHTAETGRLNLSLVKQPPTIYLHSGLFVKNTPQYTEQSIQFCVQSLKDWC